MQTPLWTWVSVMYTEFIPRWIYYSKNRAMARGSTQDRYNIVKDPVLGLPPLTPETNFLRSLTSNTRRNFGLYVSGSISSATEIRCCQNIMNYPKIRFYCHTNQRILWMLFCPSVSCMVYPSVNQWALPRSDWFNQSIGILHPYGNFRRHYLFQLRASSSNG